MEIDNYYEFLQVLPDSTVKCVARGRDVGKAFTNFPCQTIEELEALLLEFDYLKLCQGIGKESEHHHKQRNAVIINGSVY